MFEDRWQFLGFFDFLDLFQVKLQGFLLTLSAQHFSFKLLNFQTPNVSVNLNTWFQNFNEGQGTFFQILKLSGATGPTF